MNVWQPLGFGNVFELPSLVPVTPMMMKVIGVEVHIVEFHRQMFLAILARNDVTTWQMQNGYWEPSPDHHLTDEMRAWYISLDIFG